MRRVWGIVLFAATTNFASGQQIIPSAPSQLSDNQRERVRVYSVGSGVTAPQLLPKSPIQIDGAKCKKKTDGTVIFSVLVDSAGQPRSLLFLQPTDNGLDMLALGVAVKDRFTPGTHDGVPVVIGQSLKIMLHVCAEEKETKIGQMIPRYRLISQPEQELSPLPNAPEETILEPGYLNTIGDSIKAPVLIHSVNAEFSEEARRAKYGGTCILSLVVDRNGMPEDVRIVKELGYGLNEKAVEAVKQYRFEPAMKDGEPFPVTIHVGVSFRLH